MFKKQPIENHVYDNLQTCISDEFNSKVYKYELTFEIYIHNYRNWVSKDIISTLNPFQKKKSEVQFLWKKFMTFFNTVVKNPLILMEIEPRILSKLKILQPYPPFLPFLMTLVNVYVRVVNVFFARK